MAAPKNNSFWKARAKSGREKIFSSPEALWEAACEYFKWCDSNPWYRNEAVKSGDLAGEIMAIPTTRPYTMGGLCLFLDIDEQTFENYASKEGYNEFFGISARIKKVVYTQKFEGAAVGVFNANIIARDLGLREKQDIEHTGDMNITWNETKNYGADQKADHSD